MGSEKLGSIRVWMVRILKYSSVNVEKMSNYSSVGTENEEVFESGLRENPRVLIECKEKNKKFFECGCKEK